MTTSLDLISDEQLVELAINSFDALEQLCCITTLQIYFHENPVVIN